RPEDIEAARGLISAVAEKDDRPIYDINLVPLVTLPPPMGDLDFNRLFYSPQTIFDIEVAAQSFRAANDQLERFDFARLPDALSAAGRNDAEAIRHIKDFIATGIQYKYATSFVRQGPAGTQIAVMGPDLFHQQVLAKGK